MTKRKHQLLTESERDQILAIPTDRDHLARLYTFEPSDDSPRGLGDHCRGFNTRYFTFDKGAGGQVNLVSMTGPQRSGS